MQGWPSTLTCMDCKKSPFPPRIISSCTMSHIIACRASATSALGNSRLPKIQLYPCHTTKENVQFFCQQILTYCTCSKGFEGNLCMVNHKVTITTEILSPPCSHSMVDPLALQYHGLSALQYHGLSPYFDKWSL